MAGTEASPEAVIRDALNDGLKSGLYVPISVRRRHATDALSALDALVQQRDEARQDAATARQSASLDMGSAVGWEHRALEAEALVRAHHAVGALDGALVGDRCPICAGAAE